MKLTRQLKTPSIETARLQVATSVSVRTLHQRSLGMNDSRRSMCRKFRREHLYRLHPTRPMLLQSVQSPSLNKAVTLPHFWIDGKVLASSDWLKSLVSIGAIHWAESFNNRALIRSSPIALLVFKFFNCLRTKDSVILQKENDLLLPLDREKAGGKNFLELPAISRSFSLILAVSLVPIWEKCVFRAWAISLVSVLKHRLPQLNI